MINWRLWISLGFGLVLWACGDGDGETGDTGGTNGSTVSDELFGQACANGVTLCSGDPTYDVTFGMQDCSAAAIESAYAACNSGCREDSKPFIDCQVAATDCEAFVGCVQ
jgi:hypothetical protein